MSCFLFFFLHWGGTARGGAARAARGVIKIIIWRAAREKRRMAEMCDSKEPGDPGEAEPPTWG